MGTLYRILQDLGPFPDGTVLKAGRTTELKRLSRNSIDILLNKEVIAIAQTPPLAVLPGWEAKAERLKEVGIESVSDLITADPEEVAEELGVTIGGIEKAVDEVKGYVNGG